MKKWFAICLLASLAFAAQAAIWPGGGGGTGVQGILIDGIGPARTGVVPVGSWALVSTNDLFTISNLVAQAGITNSAGGGGISGPYVASLNGATGDVTITALDLGALTNSGVNVVAFDWEMHGWDSANGDVSGYPVVLQGGSGRDGANNPTVGPRLIIGGGPQAWAGGQHEGDGCISISNAVLNLMGNEIVNAGGYLASGGILNVGLLASNAATLTALGGYVPTNAGTAQNMSLLYPFVQGKMSYLAHTTIGGNSATNTAFGYFDNTRTNLEYKITFPDGYIFSLRQTMTNNWAAANTAGNATNGPTGIPLASMAYKTTTDIFTNAGVLTTGNGNISSNLTVSGTATVAAVVVSGVALTNAPRQQWCVGYNSQNGGDIASLASNAFIFGNILYTCAAIPPDATNIAGVYGLLGVSSGTSSGLGVSNLCVAVHQFDRGGAAANYTNSVIFPLASNMWVRSAWGYNFYKFNFAVATNLSAINDVTNSLQSVGQVVVGLYNQGGTNVTLTTLNGSAGVIFTK